MWAITSTHFIKRTQRCWNGTCRIGYKNPCYWEKMFVGLPLFYQQLCKLQSWSLYIWGLWLIDQISEPSTKMLTQKWQQAVKKGKCKSWNQKKKDTVRKVPLRSSHTTAEALGLLHRSFRGGDRGFVLSRHSGSRGIETICLREVIDPIPIFKIAIKTPSYVRIYV